ncbi:MAG: hypothetical protein HOP23_06475 [Methylococcaceae bacterium]|nr:hypothetical protein [Methylococcaceae bacterium]
MKKSFTISGAELSLMYFHRIQVADKFDHVSIRQACSGKIFGDRKIKSCVFGNQFNAGVWINGA